MNSPIALMFTGAFILCLVIAYLAFFVCFISFAVAIIAILVAAVCSATGIGVTIAPIAVYIFFIALIVCGIALAVFIVFWLLSLLFRFLIVMAGGTNSNAAGPFATSLISAAQTKYGVFDFLSSIFGGHLFGVPNEPSINLDFLQSPFGILRLFFLNAEEKAKLPTELLKMIACLKNCLCDCNGSVPENPIETVKRGLDKAKQRLKEAIEKADKVAAAYWQQVLDQLNQTATDLQDATNKADDANKAVTQNIKEAVDTYFAFFGL